MCTILVAYETHPEYPLIVAANRDEFYDRPTAPAAFWDDAPEVVGGRDLLRGGTWLGVTRAGRFAAVTNFREPGEKRPDALSRGLLVADFLRGRQNPASYLKKLDSDAARYNGFNLILGSLSELYYYSSRTGELHRLTPGLYGLSNHLLDTPWPKVARGKQGLSELLARGDTFSTEGIFRVLSDRSRADDEQLPDTGVGLELERVLSPLFIESRIYGTRSSTVLSVSREGRVEFVERTYATNGEQPSEARHDFQIETSR